MYNILIANNRPQSFLCICTDVDVHALSASCLPWVPEKGTVGASGDLAPLAHLALGMMGEGKMWSAESGWGDARYVSTDEHPSCVNYCLAC